jgi:hypothetical protein
MKEIKVELKDPIRRVFFLNRAAERAQNLEFKKLWLDKKAELLRNL